MFSVKYIKSLNRIFCLDNVCDYFRIYEDNGNLEYHLRPKKEFHTIDTSIIYFAWSDAEKRVRL
jgi:hypothetical protein